LTANLAAQTAAATAAELVLTNALATQVAAATAAEAAIEADVNVLMDVSNPAIAGSMKEIVDAMNAMSASQASDLADMLTEHNAELAAQTADSLAAIAAIQADEDQNEADFDAAIAAQTAASIAAEDALVATRIAMDDNFFAWASNTWYPQTDAFSAPHGWHGIDGTNFGEEWYNAVFQTSYPGLDSMTADSVVVSNALHIKGYQDSDDLPASYTDAATLASGTLDGTMFYHIGEPTADFPVANKHYFCEDGAWYGSPFYVAPPSYDTTVLFAAIDAAQAFVDGGGSDEALAQGHFDAIDDEIFNLTGGGDPTTLFALVDAQYAPPAFDDLQDALDNIANPPMPYFAVRITPTAGYGTEAVLIADGTTIFAPTSYGIGGQQANHSGTSEDWFSFTAEGSTTWQMSDDWGDGAYTLEILKSDGSTAFTTYSLAGYKYSLGQFQTFTVSWSGTTVSADGSAIMTFDPITGELT